jgi:hypothetical protein
MIIYKPKLSWVNDETGAIMGHVVCFDCRAVSATAGDY